MCVVCVAILLSTTAVASWGCPICPCYAAGQQLHREGFWGFLSVPGCGHVEGLQHPDGPLPLSYRAVIRPRPRWALSGLVLYAPVVMPVASVRERETAELRERDGGREPPSCSDPESQSTVP